MEKKKVLIGMSGGVDSSVAAAVLLEQGYEVAGATMRLWTESGKEEATEDAKKVCQSLGIDFYEFDFEELFKKEVVDYFVDEYINGRTPNPCIVCNKKLKFGAFYKKAVEMGFDYIATGHYAKIENNNGEYTLRMAETDKKDQSYVLYQFNQELLAHTLMPLGEYEKDWVRKKAEELQLPIANKPESMEICFVEDDNYARFITDYSGYIPNPGDMLDSEGNVIGSHKGIMYYTVGQRKGIGAYGRPMFVMEINPDNNTVVLGEKGMEYSGYLIAKDVSFISGKELTEPVEAEVKVRYSAKKAQALLEPIKNRVKVTFKEPQRAITPGQAVVFYNGDTVLGGGTVTNEK